MGSCVRVGMWVCPRWMAQLVLWVPSSMMLSVVMIMGCWMPLVRMSSSSFGISLSDDLIVVGLYPYNRVEPEIAVRKVHPPKSTASYCYYVREHGVTKGRGVYGAPIRAFILHKRPNDLSWWLRYHSE